MAERAEGMIDHCAHRLGGVTAAPIVRAEPIADLGRVLARFDTADADQLAVVGNDEGRFAVLPVDRRDKALRIVDAIRMRNARGILRDAAVVDEAHDGFDVAAARRAQHEPLGVEDGHAALFQSLREDLLC